MFVLIQGQPRPHRVPVRFGDRLIDHVRWRWLGTAAACYFGHIAPYLALVRERRGSRDVRTGELVEAFSDHSEVVVEQVPIPVEGEGSAVVAEHALQRLDVRAGRDCQ